MITYILISLLFIFSLFINFITSDQKRITLIGDWGRNLGLLNYIFLCVIGLYFSKKSNLDTAVLLGLLRSNNFHTDYNWNQSKVIGTVKALTATFTDLYPINKSQPSPGIAIGRYPEDVYDGDAFQGGNPWVLTTLAVAETYYELA